jgi:hypothetical protein
MKKKEVDECTRCLKKALFSSISSILLSAGICEIGGHSRRANSVDGVARGRKLSQTISIE